MRNNKFVRRKLQIRVTSSLLSLFNVILDVVPVGICLFRLFISLTPLFCYSGLFTACEICVIEVVRSELGRDCFICTVLFIVFTFTDEGHYLHIFIGCSA